MFKTRFINKFITPLIVMALTQLGARVILYVFLQVKVALTAASYGYDSMAAMQDFAGDITYYNWLYGRPSLTDLCWIAEVRLETNRKSLLQEN